MSEQPFVHSQCTCKRTVMPNRSVKWEDDPTCPVHFASANQPSKEYKHFVTCNGDRRVPAGEPGHSCSCFNDYHTKLAMGSAAAPSAKEQEGVLSVKQVEDIHRIIERWSTDVIDYESATDDIDAYLFGGIKQPESVASDSVAITALREAKEALEQLWAAIGDALCSGKGIEKAYAQNVASQVNSARLRVEAAILRVRSAAPVAPSHTSGERELLLRIAEAVHCKATDDEGNALSAADLEQKIISSNRAAWNEYERLRRKKQDDEQRGFIAGQKSGLEQAQKNTLKLAKSILDGESLPSCANPILVSGALAVLAESFFAGPPEHCDCPINECNGPAPNKVCTVYDPPEEYRGISSTDRRKAQPQVVAEAAGRSVQRRVALQKGEPMPTFEGDSTVAALVAKLDEAKKWCHNWFGFDNLAKGEIVSSCKCRDCQRVRELEAALVAAAGGNKT